ncbi:MAG: zinc dependent phospholipase C family protein [Deltaproteobacteria bacterium]|nr:zinc dependent phospholipase C family protein [Deltaproteobacteria bacterium]MDQ3295489.1 zinc dependent phospholipase C family protein [Myxococcota bacterium]
MPAEGIHLTALREAASSARLDAHVRQRLHRHADAARLGAILVDLPYFHRFTGEVLRYVAGIPARPSHWGAALHDGGAVALLGALIDGARREHDDTLAAIALGLASHCAIDRSLHPLINALAREHRAGKNHDASHREVEKFQSICFHESYMGRDMMGTSEITSYLAIRLTEELPERVVVLVLEAWRRALGTAPEPAEFAGYARGYRTHVRLLGSPLGKRLASRAAKDEAKPRYLHGGWGTFAAQLEHAVAASVTVLEAVGAALDASPTDVHAARAALASRLPRGTIDPQGEDVDLAVPFAVSLRRAS